MACGGSLLLLGLWVYAAAWRAQGSLEDAPECHALHELKSPHLLYTGNSSEGNVPILEYKVSDLTSFDSEFELRTLDSEGVIFFGDIGGQQNFFMLAVLQGHLSVQASAGGGQVLVSPGPRISDGEWKHVAVTKLDGAVSVRVRGHPAVMVTQSSESQMAEAGNSLLRIAIGNLLPDSTIALGVNPPLDGCMRNWHWVRQDSSVLSRTLRDSAVRRCWESIAAGSFFPGNGSVGFSPLVLGNSSVMLEEEDWTLLVELAFRPVTDTGTLFAIVDGDRNYVLSLVLNQTAKALVLRLNGSLSGSHRLPPTFCAGESQFLQLQVRAGRLVTILNGEEVTGRIEGGGLDGLRRAWDEPGSMVYFGGGPDGDSWFHGCLQTKVMGMAVDLDLAEVKRGDVRAHSCPSVLDIRDGK